MHIMFAVVSLLVQAEAPKEWLVSWSPFGMPLNLYASTANVLGAFLIGMIGAYGYLKALHYGFLVSEQVAQEIRLINAGWMHMLQFVTVGGAIAAVFQLAQLNNFAAVQAFVLGATWPTVIGQHIGGKDGKNLEDIVQRALAGTKKDGEVAAPAVNRAEVRIQGGGPSPAPVAAAGASGTPAAGATAAGTAPGDTAPSPSTDTDADDGSGS